MDWTGRANSRDVAIDYQDFWAGLASAFPILREPSPRATTRTTKDVCSPSIFQRSGAEHTQDRSLDEAKNTRILAWPAAGARACGIDISAPTVLRPAPHFDAVEGLP
jgi:hypothetical protein